MLLHSINPSTGEITSSYETSSEEDVERSIQKADHAYDEWRRTAFSERSNVIQTLGKVLQANKDAYAYLMANEMGKPVSQGRLEIEKCAWLCEYFAENAKSFLEETIIETDATRSLVSFEPLGVILAVMPWNFPFWQVFRCAIPAILAGNAIVLKHSPTVPRCGLEMEELFNQAEFPSGLFCSLLLDDERASELILHPLIRAATLTGSVRAGKAIASRAGGVLKKVVLELGGNDPYIVLEDADLTYAAEVCVASRLSNTGQSCIAAKRLIVVESQKVPFERLIVESMKKQTVGNPLSETVTVGPMARSDLRSHLHKQVVGSVARGAKLLLGGELPNGNGFFYPPTVLTDVTPGMPAFDEETFGPVASIIGAKNEVEAISLANRTEFGLGASVFTRNIKKGEKMAKLELEAGAAFVNAAVKSDPRLPMGGIKSSGYGRELSVFGIREFTNIKTVYVK